MAFFRALETSRPSSARLFADPFAVTVLPRSFRIFADLSRSAVLRPAICGYVQRRWPGALTSAVARTRLIDDWIAGAVGRGARQAVLLGAGFDSRAWRLPALMGIPVFEVDHPATAGEKRNRLIAAGLDPSKVVQVVIDFDREALAPTLARYGFDPCVPTLVVWEGVTNYLTRGAVDAVLRWVGGLGDGSTLTFTYIHADVLADPKAFEGADRMLAAVARAGEAWTFGIQPAELGDYLRPFGLTLVEDLGADEYRTRYGCPDRGYAFYRAALAAVRPALRR